MPDIISAVGLTVIRGGRRIIDDISLRLPAGKVTMLLGHNGAGKTVLARTLHGLMTADHGTISGVEHHQQKMVFQKPILLRRSAHQHLRFVCPNLDEATRMNWLERAGLDNLTDQHCHTLSGGEQQKLAMIGAMASTPKLLFLDEPTAHLDIDSTMFIEDMIREARADGMSVLMISHSRSQAERLAEHVVFLDTGKLVETCSPKQFFTKTKSAKARRFLAHL